MSLRRADAEALNLWVESLIGRSIVVGVQAKQDHFVFAPLLHATDLRLDYDVTILPPKAIFQPQWETLLTFDADHGYQTVIEAEPFTLLGVHPYDLVAISQMDTIFSQSNPDLRYLTRRENATIVAVDVESVSENVFAGFMGTSNVEDGFDVLLTRIDDGYLVDARTEKGEAILDGLPHRPDDEASRLTQRTQIWEQNRHRLRRHELRADPSAWPRLLDEGYEHPVWEEKAALCFSCGSCTLVCPTCYCFDVRDEVDWDLSTGRRVRVWDGCMLTDFAAVAGGLNFRRDVAARYRHRYYRKGKYVPAKIGGQIACVGCGRCITACVANIANPVEVFNRLSEGI